AGIPVGWRFMDKFIQLPFVIPPAEASGLTRYTMTLFAAGDGQSADPAADELAREGARRITTRGAVAEEVKRLQQEHQLNDTQAARLEDQLNAQFVQRTIDEGIERFTDKNPDIQRVIEAATFYFKGNPRELKRFVNAFRFQYFLWWAQRAQGLPAPILDQLVRWTVLSMKWPEVTRWLRRSGGNEWRAAQNGSTPDVTTRLALIEEISGKATDLATWHKLAFDTLRLDPKSTPWLSDDDLLEFFHHEGGPGLQGQRLSDGAGKGLW
ncbi:MAG TPA: P-loop NTPase fold protein, partial [Roseiflexaceae bacterium]